ncbi:MAG: flavodoxin domain-containing protein [Deltaproteobacteria bacterium]|nr:flavodoxin domain-containing protein [Deltaproteobacteria bacterium]
MAKALIVFATRSGQTQNIADLVAEGIRFTGVDAKVVSATQLTKQEEMDGYDAYVFGSATYHGEMMQAMKTLLFLAAKLDLDGKVGGSFGAFGWSGEAPDRIYDTMQNILKMDMVGSPLRLKSAVIQGGMQMAQDYGREIGKKISGK